jgi:hypothetical protein
VRRGSHRTESIRILAQLSPIVLESLYEFQEDIRDGFIFTDHYWRPVIRDVKAVIGPKRLFFSILVHRLFNSHQCDDQELEELFLYLLFPVWNFTVIFVFIDYNRNWKAVRGIPAFLERLVRRLVKHVCDFFRTTFRKMITAIEYFRGMRSTVKTTTENAGLERKLSKVEAGLSAALLGEAQAVITIALFGRKNKANGNKILALNTARIILQASCEKWSQEVRLLTQENGHEKFLDDRYARELKGMQNVIDKQAKRIGSVEEALVLAHTLRRNLGGVESAPIENRTAHDTEMTTIQRKLETLKNAVQVLEASYQERNVKGFELGQEIGTQQQEICNERSLRRQAEKKLLAMTVQSKKYENIAAEPEHELADHNKGQCVLVCRLRKMGKVNEAKLLESHTQHDIELESLIGQKDVLARELSEVKRSGRKGASKEDAEKIKRLEQDKKEILRKLDHAAEGHDGELKKVKDYYEAKLVEAEKLSKEAKVPAKKSSA